MSRGDLGLTQATGSREGDRTRKGMCSVTTYPRESSVGPLSLRIPESCFNFETGSHCHQMIVLVQLDLEVRCDSCSMWLITMHTNLGVA